MRSMLLTCAVVLCLPTVGSSGQSQNVRIEPFPESPYLNATRTGLELHIDFIVSNDSARSLTVTRVELSVFGRDGRLAQRRFVSAANGPNSGLLTIPRREIGPGGKLTLFNPFYLFDPDLEIGRAVFEFTLAGAEQTLTRSVSVHPVPYDSSTSLELPLRGRTLVWDGHDSIRITAGRTRAGCPSRKAASSMSRSATPTTSAWSMKPATSTRATRRCPPNGMATAHPSTRPGTASSSRSRTRSPTIESSTAR